MSHALFIITGIYVMAVNVTEMNAVDDQSEACLKDPGEMSWQEISLLTATAVTPPPPPPPICLVVTLQTFITPQHSHKSNYSAR